MLVYPQLNPVAIDLGFFQIHWYGLMYLLAFAMVLVLGRYRIKTQPWWHMQKGDLDDILFYGVLGVILGGRIGYVLFYNLPTYLHHPIEIFYVWRGGMSFHGGFVGVLLAMWLYCRKTNRRWLSLMDFLAPLVPLGLGAGRLGNFINGELPGRPTSVPWGMVFPQVDNLPRHPSQLYELGLEGITLFIILWLYSRKQRPTGAVSSLFLIGYGLARFLVEFTRQPDPQLGLLALGLSMGQWLSLPMIIAGIALWIWAHRRAVPTQEAQAETKYESAP